MPPQYHRSEELTIDRTTTRLVIDSYGDVLADESRPTPPEVWRGLVASIDAIAELPVEDAQEGCVGGTSQSIQVTSAQRSIVDSAQRSIVDSAQRSIVDVVADECAGANAQASKAIRDLIAPARSLFPPTETLAPTG